jgi:hypothetical protein
MTQERYSRQILFKDIGEHGQQTINQKTSPSATWVPKAPIPTINTCF